MWHEAAAWSARMTAVQRGRIARPIGAVSGRVACVIALLCYAALPAPAAAAAPARVSSGRVVCTITDPSAIGLSGLIVTGNGYISVSDSNIDKSKIRIFYFDKGCKLVRTVGYPTPAYDPEDVAMGTDGTLYVADIGDNAAERSSIAVWKLAPDRKTPKIFRYAYPDHPHDAEAMLLGAGDTPIFVTKDIGVGRLYVPVRSPDPSGKPVPLRAAGTFRPTDFGTPSGVGLGGGLLVTGAANARDRSKVALRTYSTAYEWRVPDGDVVHAITASKPVVTPLPDEPQGEAIAYSRDGSHLVTVSDQETDPVRTSILTYPSGIPAVTATSAEPSGVAAAETHGASPVPGPASGLPGDALGIIAGVGGLLLIAGAVGIGRARRRQR